MLATEQLGSTTSGTTMADLIINNTIGVANGVVGGFASFIHDPKPLQDQVTKFNQHPVPTKFAEAVVLRRALTGLLDESWKFPLNLTSPLTTPTPYTFIESQEHGSSSGTTTEYQIMRTVDFIGRNYIRFVLPMVDTTTISTGGAPMTDPTNVYFGAWHRDLVPRIIDSVQFYPRSSQHKLFKYSGYDVYVHNIIFGNEQKQMNDLMGGEDQFELCYDPYRVHGSSLGIASFKGVDMYIDYVPESADGSGVVYRNASAQTLGKDGFVDLHQFDSTMDNAEFRNQYRKNVWYETPVARPYDERHSIHSRRLVHRAKEIIVPLDVLPFGYSIASSLPTAALAGECGYISISRYSDWFDRSFYLTRLSDIPSIYPIANHRHYAQNDYAPSNTLDPQSGTLVDNIARITEATDPRVGWVNELSLGKYGDPDANALWGADDLADTSMPTDTRIRQPGNTLGVDTSTLDGVMPHRNQPITGAGATPYLTKASAYGGRVTAGFANVSRVSTSAAASAATRLDYDSVADPTGRGVFIHKPSTIDSAWARDIASQILMKLIQVGYVTLPCIREFLSKLPNIYLTTEWDDQDFDISNTSFDINNDLYIMAMLMWFLPEDSNGVTSMRVYPHHKIDSEYPIVAGVQMKNEQSQGNATLSWDMLNLMTPAHLGLNPLLSNMGMVSFTPTLIPNTFPLAYYDVNLSGKLQFKYLRGTSDTTNYSELVNLRKGTVKVISIGINGCALVNLNLYRLVF